MTFPIIFNINELNNEILMKKACEFNAIGVVMQQGEYSYLNIADKYVHELYPLLGDNITAQKPDYFSADTPIGAHITIAYPEESILLKHEDIGREHIFSIKNLSHIILGNKEYFVLMVSSPSLAQLRIKYGLPEKPRYKGVSIDFHITIATSELEK